MCHIDGVRVRMAIGLPEGSVYICLLSMVKRCFVRFVQRLAYRILVGLPRCGQHM